MATFLEQLKTIISTDLPADPLQELPDDPAEAGPDAELRPLLVSAALHNQRLDRALVALVPEFSRSYLQQLIEAGGVTLSGKPAVKASARVKAGERGEIELRPTPQSQAFLPEPMALDVVFEENSNRIAQQSATAAETVATRLRAGQGVRMALLAREREADQNPTRRDELTDARIQALRSLLAQHGVPPDQIRITWRPSPGDNTVHRYGAGYRLLTKLQVAP